MSFNWYTKGTFQMGDLFPDFRETGVTVSLDLQFLK